MIDTVRMAAVALLALTACGCGKRVMVPPRIDLKQHEVVGIIDFDCPSRGDRADLLTARFVEAARRDQGMVRFLRLGPRSEVLATVEHSRLEPAAFRAIGRHYEVQTVVTGQFEVSELHPQAGVWHSLTAVKVSADVDASLAVEMVETAGGASIWSRSASGARRVGEASFNDRGFVAFDLDDPEDAYARLVDDLVEVVTRDFHVTWRRE
jgi:hypothetical protein